MERIITYLGKQCSFLYSPYNFQIVDTNSSESFGNALVILEDEDLRLQFVKDRDQLFLDIQPISYKKEWFSIDIVMHLVTGNIESTAELDSTKITFLKTNLKEIKQLLSPPQLKKTIKEIKELEHARAKRIFS